MKYKYVIIFFGFFFILGKCLDLEAERVIHQFFDRHPNNVIIGGESIAPKHKNHTNAILLLHGFLDTPHIFAGLVQDLEKYNKTDIYVPLLPYHGIDLQTAAKMNNNVIENYIQMTIKNLSKKYNKVLVVGYSYSGAQLVNLIYKESIPNNVYPILYAPAIYISLNTPINSFRNKLFGLWRNYCNYEFLGCETKNSKSLHEINFNYKVVSSVEELFKLDIQTRNLIPSLKNKFSIIIAINDNRITFSKIRHLCLQNQKFCKLYILNHGKHYLHRGEMAKYLSEIFINELQNFEKQAL